MGDIDYNPWHGLLPAALALAMAAVLVGSLIVFVVTWYGQTTYAAARLVVLHRARRVGIPNRTRATMTVPEERKLEQ